MIPLPLLPEIFFYDIDKEKQVYDDPPKAIFRLNIIGNMSGFDLRLCPYTDRWFSTLTKVFTDNFKDQLGEIASFVMGKDKKQEEEEDEYMRLKALSDAMDEEGEDEEAEVEGEPEGPPTTLFNIWGFIKGLYNKFKTLLKWLKNITKFLLRLTKRVVKKLRKWVKRGIKLLKKILKSLKKIGRRIIKTVKKIFGACWRSIGRFLLAFWRKIARFLRSVIRFLTPLIKSVLRSLVIYALKSGRFFKYLLSKPFRRILKPTMLAIGRILKRRLPALLLKRGVRMMAIKTLMKRVGSAVAGIAANAVPVLGTAFDVFLWLWAIYDLFQLGKAIYSAISEALTEANLLADEMERAFDEEGNFKFSTPKEIYELLSSDNPYRFFDSETTDVEAERKKRELQEKAKEEIESVSAAITQKKQAAQDASYFYNILDGYRSDVLSIMGRIYHFQLTVETWFKHVGANALSLVQYISAAFQNFHQTIISHLEQFVQPLETVIAICNEKLPQPKDKDPTKVRPLKRKIPTTEEEINALFKKEMQPLVDEDKYQKEHWWIRKVFHSSGDIEIIKIEDEGVNKTNPIPEDFYDMSYEEKKKWIANNKDYIQKNLNGKNKDITATPSCPKSVMFRDASSTYEPQLQLLAQKKRLLELILDKFQRIQNFYHSKIEVPV